VTTTTYLGSGDASRHRRDYRPEWLDNLADDATIEGSVLTGIAQGPEAIRAILGFARTLYEYQEFSYVGRYGDHGARLCSGPGSWASTSPAPLTRSASSATARRMRFTRRPTRWWAEGS
jgi:hypothetical protein